MHPPSNELPVALPWSGLLGRNDDLAVALIAARAYRTGLVLDVAVRLRTTDQHELFEHVSGYHSMSSPDRLLPGAQFADGRVGQHSLWSVAGRHRDGSGALL
jgi:hypothetical protein